MTERESDTYRRGLSLGLTMAEIFILILFLLLLVLLALYAFNAETEKQFKQTQTELAETKKQLQEAKKSSDQLKAELIAIRNQINGSRSLSPEEIEHLIRVNESLTTALINAETENTISEKLLTDAKKQQAQANQKNKSLYEKIENLKKKLNQLTADKGIDPPCWYQNTERQGKRHEKPYFLMDIAVYDKYLEIRTQEAPQGRAVDERNQQAITSYQEEYEKLPLPLLGTTKKVSLQQFAEITEPIKRMGKNEQIRNYACVFHVKVWDFTPETAKARWKEAEDAIKESFYTLRISKDPW